MLVWNKLDFLIRFLVYSNIWVSTGLTTLACFCMQVLGVNPDISLLILCFSSALLVMNFDRVIDSHYEKRPDINEQEFYFSTVVNLLLFAAAFGTILGFLLMPINVQLIAVSYIGIGVIYGIPLFRIAMSNNSSSYRLKDISGIKAWLVATAITLAAVGLPLAYDGNIHLDWEVYQLITFVYVFVVSNAHMFDVRDLNHDQEKGLKTLPVLVGIFQTKVLIILLNILMLSIILWCQYLGYCQFYTEAIIATCYTLFYVLYLNMNKSRLLYALLVDGSLFLPLLLLLMHSKFTSLFLS